MLGGTRFVGRMLVERAVAVGHEVTTFNRGRTGTDVQGVTAVHGDREDPRSLEVLVEGREWDCVVDTSGYVPAVTVASAKALSGRAEAYLFLSTISVYPDWPNHAASEESQVYPCDPTVTGTAEDEANWSAAQYGAYKAGCEQAVRENFSGQVTILRPGVILGPYENVGRLTWWLRRIARGGELLAPGSQHQAIQPVDIRDLVDFAYHCLARGIAGTFNTTAPEGHATFGELLDACITATGSTARLTWVSDDFLLQHGVRQWTEVPLWRTPPGTWSVDSNRAAGAGLSCRPLRETVVDTWAWLSDSQGPRAYDRQARHGLSAEKEALLLADWKKLSARGEVPE